MQSGLQTAGEKTIRRLQWGLEWLFGIESVEDDSNSNRIEWEARQRRLHKLRTDKLPRKLPITYPCTKTQTETDTIDADTETRIVSPRGGSAKDTGRDPNSTIMVPQDPKPHVWTLVRNGIKLVAHRTWEGTPPLGAHIHQPAKESFYKIDGQSGQNELDSIDGSVGCDCHQRHKGKDITKYDFFGMDITDYPDGVPDPLPPPDPPIRRQQIKGGDNVDDEVLRRKSWIGGVVRVICCRPIGEGPLDRLDKLLQHRPFFTYWITFVQILVMIVVSAVYGFAPYGWDFKSETELIQRTNLGIEPITRTVTTSIWGGPSQEDLVLLGARYAPCMRRDERLFDLIEQDRITESMSGCCIRNDGSGCVQMNSRSDCLGNDNLTAFTQFKQIDERMMVQPSGVVCGQSPRTCLAPKSQPPHQWSNDITRWPICTSAQRPSNQSFDNHLSCDVTGRPCCFGILAKCVIATQEFCNFMKGRFHEDATLCSQVNCLGDVCGLIPFVDEDQPDQFYRIWLSLFLHAGWIHLLLTVVFHVILMRDVEKHIGWFRVGIIYLGSGFAGNIFSGTFIPYFPAVGPAGSLMGILSTLIIFLWLEWERFVCPRLELIRLLVLVAFAVIIGLFPYVDNFAHIGGLVTGALLAALFMPYYQPYEGEAPKVPEEHEDESEEYEEELRKYKEELEKHKRKLREHKKKYRNKKCAAVAICLPTFIIVYTVIFVLFYVVQPNCSGCQYITCIPFTDTICQDQRPSPDNRDMNL